MKFKSYEQMLKDEHEASESRYEKMREGCFSGEIPSSYGNRNPQGSIKKNGAADLPEDGVVMFIR